LRAANRCAGRAICFIGKADTRAGVGLYHDLMTSLDERVRAGRRQPNAVFVVFDFFWDANEHCFEPCW
jgi:hypothetical protein